MQNENGNAEGLSVQNKGIQILFYTALKLQEVLQCKGLTTKVSTKI